MSCEQVRQLLRVEAHRQNWQAWIAPSITPGHWEAFWDGAYWTSRRTSLNPEQGFQVAVDLVKRQLQRC